MENKEKGWRRKKFSGKLHLHRGGEERERIKNIE